MEPRHPGIMHLLSLFAFDHLPPHLAAVSAPISELAYRMVDGLSDGAELSAGLRKLLEAKDCLVRQAVIDAKAPGGD